MRQRQVGDPLLVEAHRRDTSRTAVEIDGHGDHASIGEWPRFRHRWPEDGGVQAPLRSQSCQICGGQVVQHDPAVLMRYPREPSQNSPRPCRRCVDCDEHPRRRRNHAPSLPQRRAPRRAFPSLLTRVAYRSAARRPELRARPAAIMRPLHAHRLLRRLHHRSAFFVFGSTQIRVCIAALATSKLAITMTAESSSVQHLRRLRRR